MLHCRQQLVVIVLVVLIVVNIIHLLLQKTLLCVGLPRVCTKVYNLASGNHFSFDLLVATSNKKSNIRLMHMQTDAHTITNLHSHSKFAFKQY